MKYMCKLIGYFREKHRFFWGASLAWMCVVGTFWYLLFNSELPFTVPEGESGYTFGYFIGALGVGAIGIVLLGRRTHALMEQVENDKGRVEIDRTKATNENFTKSIELLGNENVTIRQGGIYALQRQLSEKGLYATILRIISAFVRDKSREVERGNSDKNSTLPVDIEAALIVMRDRKSTDPESYENKKIASRKAGDSYLFDLSNSYLLNVDLNDIDFRYWNLSDSNIIGCSLRRAKFESANLSSTSFFGTDLTEANFSEANFKNIDSGEIKGGFDDKCLLIGITGIERDELDKLRLPK